MQLEDHIKYVISAHRNHYIEQGEQTRKWDGKTPYSTHPIWCAMTILTETSLPQELREKGCLVLLYHDVLEDTTIGLPEELPEDVKSLVREMTFPGGSVQEMNELWNRSPEVKLFKLYDKVSNLLDGIWMGEERSARYRYIVERLVDDVETMYGKLNIVRMAREFLPQ